MPETAAQRDPKRAPCTGLPINTFFPESDSRTPDKPNAHERAALLICAGCPLAARRTCLENALAFPSDKQYGVVGCTTAAQRKAIIRGRRAELLAGVAA